MIFFIIYIIALKQVLLLHLLVFRDTLKANFFKIQDPVDFCIFPFIALSGRVLEVVHLFDFEVLISIVKDIF